MKVSHKKYIYLIIGLFITLILVLLLFSDVLISLLRKPLEPLDLEPRVRKEISEEEILESVTAPRAGREISEKIFEGLTAPQAGREVSEELLEGLTAPQ